jgi:hypothetical protein
MKFTFTAATLISLFGSALAFTNPIGKSQTTLSSLKMAYTTPEKSKSVPFLNKNPLLDGSMPGDVGFDPFFLADSGELLYNYREAEIKHCRLAMLAAAGWPISELLQRPLANTFGLQPVVDANDKVPSVLNGGLERTDLKFFLATLAFASFLEAAAIHKRQVNPDYFPGNLNFDPLGLYPKDESGQKAMQLAEVKNGRLAMIAITAFAFQEFVSNQAVINETPEFFKPFFSW